jgi:hypothetical protein
MNLTLLIRLQVLALLHTDRLAVIIIIIITDVENYMHFIMDNGIGLS